MPDCAFYQHSSIQASMHPYVVHCPGPCRMTKSVLHVHVHAACPCACCMPCPCCMFMSMLHSMSTLHSLSMLHSMSMLHVHVYVHVHVEMPAVRHPVSPVPDWKTLTMPKQVRTKQTQSGIFLVRYRTKIRDTGMPMPALVSSMLIPSYENNPCNWEFIEPCVHLDKPHTL
jgi:hypothetical protein